MRIWEFVLTGGPCGGKTSAMSKLEEQLTHKGYYVICVAETATELSDSGIKPGNFTTEQFQTLVISRTINKEQTARLAAKFHGKDTVILYDRGILDNKAYMPYEMFERLLSNYGLTETMVRDQYDGVIHMMSTAVDAEEIYNRNKDNNAARTEDAEEAREKDKKTKNAWIGHAHFRVIDNSTDFERKKQRVLNEICSTMGIPVPIETERKFLIRRPTEEMLDKVEAITKLNIFQTYLKSDNPDVERRIRQRGDGKSYSYTYTEKKKVSDMSREEIERKISEREYISLLGQSEKSILKDRYCFLYENQYFELDIYPNWKDEAILEIELTSEAQKVIIPEWIEVIKEVTDDPYYKNYNLAK